MTAAKEALLRAIYGENDITEVMQGHVHLHTEQVLMGGQLMQMSCSNHTEQCCHPYIVQT